MKTPIRYGAYGKYSAVFGVQSESNLNKIYTVARTAENVWSCACPRWTLNAGRPECKHIKHVKQFVGSASRLDFEPIQIMPETVQKALGRFAAIEV